MVYENNKKTLKCTYPGIKKNSYLVSGDGEIYSLLRDKYMNQRVDADGYRRVHLTSDNKKSKNIFVHRLVAYEFVPNPKNNPVVDHVDGIKENNHYSNLEWVTIKENTNRAEDMGLRKIKGEDNGNNKYSEELIREICQLLEDGLGTVDIFRKLCGEYTLVDSNRDMYTLIEHLRRKEGWPHVTCEYEYDIKSTKRKGKCHKPTIKENNKYPESLIRQICELLEKKYTSIEVYEHFTNTRNLDANPGFYDMIQGLRNRKNWEYITKDYNYNLHDTNGRKKLEDDERYEEIYNLASEGYTKKQIMKAFGILSHSDNVSAYNRISRIVDKYKAIKNTPDNQIIQIAV